MNTAAGILGLDFETTSGCDIARGSWPYSEHESTLVLCAVFCYATPGGVREWWEWQPGEELPAAIARFVQDGGLLLAHNYGFEHAIWTNVCRERYGWPPVAIEQWRDTQVMARSINLPPSIEGLGKTLKINVRKDTDGGKLMREMASAELDESGEWIYPWIGSKSKRRRLLDYCRIDVEVMVEAYFKMASLAPIDAVCWAVDKVVNARGVFLDERFAAKCARMAEERTETLAEIAWETSYGDLANATSTPGLKKWLKAKGIELPKVARKRKDGSFVATESCSKAVCVDLLKKRELPDDVRAVLQNRVEANKATSLSKLKRVPELVGKDGRLRNALAFGGASTGRWTSYGLQLHNLPKNKLSTEQARLAFWCCDNEDLEALCMSEDYPLAAMSQLLRSVIRAAPGHEIIAADYSAIEARVLAWLCEHEGLLEQFRAGNDIYVYTAESIESDDRQLGKVCQLALGYGMGVLKFFDTAAAWGVPLALVEARRVQKAWREANGPVTQFWRELEAAFRECIAEHGRRIAIGPTGLSVIGGRANIRIRLPSGRELYYWRPRIATVERTFETVDEHGVITKSTRTVEEIQFWSVGQDKKSMARESTYGGKLVENVTQAVARDLLAYALPIIEKTDPYRVVMHVHDSIAAEVPTGAGDVDEFCQLMASKPHWAAGLPLDTEGYRDLRFRG